MTNINSLNDFSITPVDNDNIAGTSIAVGCAPQDVGVFMRTIMAQIAYAVQGAGGAIPATWHVGELDAATAKITGTLTVGTLAFQAGANFDVATLSVAGETTATGGVAAGSLEVVPNLGITVTPGSNTGTGTISTLSAQTGPRVGNYTVTLSSATSFAVTDPLGNAVGTGTVGVAFSNQIGFLLTAGAVAFVASDSFAVAVSAVAVTADGSPGGSNIGNSVVGAVVATTGVRIGTYVATFSSATAFFVRDPLGTMIGTGTVGATFNTQINFTIIAGSVANVAGDVFNFPVTAGTIIQGSIVFLAGSLIPAAGTLRVAGDLQATGNVHAADAASGDELVTYQQIFGAGLQDVTGSRAAGTVYTNATKRTIFVSVNITSTATASALLTIGAVGLLGSGGVAGFGLWASGPVEPGQSYSAGVNSGTPTLIQWLED